MTETYLSLAEAAGHFPGKPHISTLWRWATRGCRGIKLETVRRAGRRFTTIEAVARFIDATNDGANGQPIGTLPETRAKVERRRRKEIEAADAELDREGMLAAT